ncbi:TetR/AcrR family transcriptional regulator [Bombilactobacillus folatiphilus]|uniref:TetR/AcrR family transcriptional regulator n=1 Tax=Bombilactobacillus folatiphilus TaxID=2923362 RepID=A0ABY4P9G7_9LACO|nr:TetR/AcrR family transcriptional regulator [Bombilactobacillus folatiphilus]UQS82176.1 TetR/AcrR family transcriptional regulator [Bombilactobacillus folatiphilus]
MSNQRVTKDQIIQTAQGIIFHEGLTALSFPRLSKMLAIRSQALYNYFDNLDDLVNQIGAIFMDNLYQQVIESLVGLSGKAAFKKYAEVAHDYFESQGKMVELIYDVHKVNRESQFYQNTAKVLALLNKLVDSVHLKQMHAQSYVQTLISSVLGFTAIEMMGFLPPEKKQRQLEFQELLNLQLSEIDE